MYEKIKSVINIQRSLVWFPCLKVIFSLIFSPLLYKEYHKTSVSFHIMESQFDKNAVMSVTCQG